jgi:hypothetical protein
MINKSFIGRKKAIEKRLSDHGINDIKIQYLPYLDFDPESFAKPFDVGRRIIILYAVSIAAQHEKYRQKIMDWLKAEGLWEHVSERETKLFEGKVTDKKALVNFSWQIEAAYVLAWSLGLVTKLSVSCQPIDDEEFNEFDAVIPLVGEPLNDFLTKLHYIDETIIIDENLFNELVTTYLRDIYFNGNPNTSTVDSVVSFERHKALNWLRRFSGFEEWDETDTST